MFGAARILTTCSRRLLKPRRRWQSRQSSTFAIPIDAHETIYPALLETARRISAQHVALSKELESSYDVKTAKKAGELMSIATALQSWEKASTSLKELQSLLRDPTTDAELKELAQQDLEMTAKDLQEASNSLTKSLIPKHPFSELPCLIEIRPGAGGSEAGLFAGELLLMYQAFCANKGLKTTMISCDRGDDDENQIVGAIMEIESQGAYGILKTESGVHRVQRVPATESKGRTHTSAVSVMVLPSFPESNDSELNFNDPTSDYYLEPGDVRKDYLRSSGAGGQHVNKTQSAVRLTHLPSKLQAHVQDFRNQPQNERRAWSLLRSRVAHLRRSSKEDEILKLRRNAGGKHVDRSDKIRTYNFQQQRTTDHRSGITLLGIDGVLSGGQSLEKVMDSVRDWMTSNEVEALLADSESASASPTRA